MIKKYSLSNTIALGTLFLSFIAFWLGLWYPIISTKQHVFGFTLKYEEIRVTDSIKLFFESGDYLLAFIIAFFVVVMPIVKYVDLTGRLGLLGKKWKLSKYLSAIDKWSMIDVFLVALLVLNYKMNSNIVVMKLKLGTTFIAVSVIFRIIATQFLKDFSFNGLTKKKDF